MHLHLALIIYKFGLQYILGRFYDGWYPPPGLRRKLKRFNRVDVELTSAENDSIIKCGRPRPSFIPHCGGKRYMPCLFNIKKDPCEYEDLSKKYPIIHKIMLSRLNEYRKRMVKSRRTTYRDPKSNPKIRDGVWLPWKQLKWKNKASSFFGLFQLPYSLNCKFTKNELF